MRRYCLVKDLVADDFPEIDKDNYIDISVGEIARNILENYQWGKDELPVGEKTRIMYNSLLGINISEYDLKTPLNQEKEQILLLENWELLNLWKHIFCSTEYKLDILADVFLIFSYLQKEGVKLFFEDNPVINDKMIETIKNIKKSKKKGQDSYPYIFNMDKIDSVKKGLTIPQCGSGIVRLWLFEKKFRNLFVETETTYEKYRPSNIYNIIKTDKELGIDYNKSDLIIMEKLLGIQTENELYKYIIQILESKINIKKLQSFIDELMKYHGERSRCAIIQCIGFNLYSLKCSRKKYNEDYMIELYAILLRIFRRKFNEIYKKTLHMVLEEYKKYFSVTTCIKKASYYFEELLHLGLPLYLNNPVYQTNIKKRNDLYLIEQISKLEKRDKDKEQQLKLLWERDTREFTMKSFCIEDEYQQDVGFNRADEDLRAQIQKEIVIDNLQKYSIINRKTPE